MELKDEFEHAVRAAEDTDFNSAKTDEISVFETTICHLGGLLSSYEISGKGHRVLLQKAVELGELLMGAFDTWNRMSITRWNWRQEVFSVSQGV